MNLSFNRTLIFVLIAGLVLTGCQKEELNKVPVANAGPAQEHQLPLTHITLSGTGVDADGDILAYLWSQVSGPAATIIENPGNKETKVSGFKVGEYVYQLMVTDDDGATGVDTLTVKINASPEVTLTLQPVSNNNEFSLAALGNSDYSNKGALDIPIINWTIGGNTLLGRGMLKFDLSGIPEGATIVSANLSLYSYPSPTTNGDLTNANSGSNNSMLLQRVTSNWDRVSINWLNQPQYTTTDQVVIPATTQSMLDLNIDVKTLVSKMIPTGQNNGFLLRLQNEAASYNSRLFVSSRNTTHATKHPKLVVVYK